MAAVLERIVDNDIAAPLGYIEPQSERPYDYAVAPPAGKPWSNYRSDLQPVRIADARRLETAPGLHREGFMLAAARSEVGDFLDEAAIVNVYYPEVAALARAAVGGSRAYVFDHLVRRREAGPALTFGRRVSGQRPSANGRVHNDYTEASGARRMEQVVAAQHHPHPNPPPEGEGITLLRPEGEGMTLLRPEGEGITLLPPQGEGRDGGGLKRYAIVNVWRPIKGPVLDAPLALCDARSVSAADLIASDVHYADRTGEIYLVTRSKRHRWFYFPEMQPSEALVFKQYDSDAGAAARFVPHAAFDHPDTPADAPLRESIEARVLVVFE